jgi:hypothetical protein
MVDFSQKDQYKVIYGTNKKAIERTAHADRDGQFQQINRTGKAFEAEGLPMISVECKKNELIGNFKNNGRE